jgi:uncharacterized membrane protein
MIAKLSRLMNVIAGIGLTFMILITVADVILRSFRRPILGTYELVAFSGAVVIGFSIPFTSWLKGYVDAYPAFHRIIFCLPSSFPNED